MRGRGEIVRVRQNPLLRPNSACGCAAPRAPRPVVAERRRLPRTVRASIEPRTPRGAESIELFGRPGSRCRPHLKIEKDPEGFAACNALAEELGPLDDPKKAFQLIEEAISNEVNEVFGVMMLDLHLRFKGLSETGRGEPAAVMAPLKPTLQMALAQGAYAIIIFHVHPSGIEAKPSEADEETTEAFADACATVDLPLIDHIIVGGDARKRSYYSFAEDGAL